MIPIKEYVANKKEELKQVVSSCKNIKLVIVQVGNVEASNRYVKNKLKDCAEVGINAELLHLGEQISESALLDIINELNNEPGVTGYIVQLPLPKHINEQHITEAIDYRKDVDGFSKKALVNPATPQGIIDYLEYNNYDFTNKNVVVIGRSNIVGRPMAKLLLDRNCNVSVIHSKTSIENKRALLLNANLIVVATGHRNTLTNNDLGYSKFVDKYDNCFIIDVGININDEGKLVGDCEAVTVCEKTPVPGGCGLLTRLALITNLMKLAKL